MWVAIHHWFPDGSFYGAVAHKNWSASSIMEVALGVVQEVVGCSKKGAPPKDAPKSLVALRR